MVKTAIRRTKGDPVAIATKGRVTSQIETQTSGDKPTIISTLDEN